MRAQEPEPAEEEEEEVDWVLAVLVEEEEVLLVVLVLLRVEDDVVLIVVPVLPVSPLAFCAGFPAAAPAFNFCFPGVGNTVLPFRLPPFLPALPVPGCFFRVPPPTTPPLAGLTRTG